MPHPRGPSKLVCFAMARVPHLMVVAFSLFAVEPLSAVPLSAGLTFTDGIVYECPASMPSCTVTLSVVGGGGANAGSFCPTYLGGTGGIVNVTLVLGGLNPLLTSISSSTGGAGVTNPFNATVGAGGGGSASAVYTGSSLLAVAGGGGGGGCSSTTGYSGGAGGVLETGWCGSGGKNPSCSASGAIC